ATATGAVVGTAAYLAPEQVRGGPVEPAADVFALGLVLLEALTGRLEYPGTVIESATARLHRRPVVPHGLPWNLTELFTAMTDPDPAERPTAAAIATTALAPVHSPLAAPRALSAAPPPDPPSGAAHPVLPRRRDRLASRTPVLVIAGLLLAVLLGGVSLLTTTAHLNAATPPAKASAPAPSTREVAGGPTTEPATSSASAVAPPAAPLPADVASPAAMAPVAAHTRTSQIADGNDHAASVERVHATDSPRTVEDADEHAAGNANGKDKGDGNGNGKQKDKHGSNSGEKGD
ncbi:MAG TPA: protein kinase, partial [Pseudonocardia sp.]